MISEQTKTIDKSSVKPFVKWVGGKTQLITTIEKNLPRKLYEPSKFTYVEPFVGGGAILFWFLKKFNNIGRAIINDINPDLIMAYRTIQTRPNDLIKELSHIQNEYHSIETEERRREYFISKREHFNTKNLDSIENTALFIFLNRTCFNGLYRVNSKGLFNVPFGKHIKPKICDEKTILADSEVLQKVEILMGDFAQTLQYASDNSFFYIDPPYKPLSITSSFNTYAKESFDDNEQMRLKTFCDEISKRGSHFIVSNSDAEAEFFDQLYSDYEIQRVSATRSVNSNPEKRGKLLEVLVRNDKAK